MVKLTDRLDTTIAVDWDVKPQTKQTNHRSIDTQKIGREIVNVFYPSI